MKTVSVSNLKARLSEYLVMAKRGEEVIITERGAPIARLGPLSSGQELSARLEGLVRAGVARPPTGPLPEAFWDLPRPSDPEGSVRRALLEERREGR